MANNCSDTSLWHWPKDSSFNIPLSQNLTLFKGPFPLPTFFWCIQKKGLISWLFDCCCCCPLSGHAVPRPEDACGFNFFSWLQCFQLFRGLELQTNLISSHKLIHRWFGSCCSLFIGKCIIIRFRLLKQFQSLVLSSSKVSVFYSILLLPEVHPVMV